MFPHPSDRAHASANDVTDYVTVPAITQEELDGLQVSFRDHARYVLNHSQLTVRGYQGAYGNFRRFLRELRGITRNGGRLIRHARYFTLQLAESYLTRLLFRQTIARIERLGWHPT